MDPLQNEFWMDLRGNGLLFYTLHRTEPDKNAKSALEGQIGSDVFKPIEQLGAGAVHAPPRGLHLIFNFISGRKQ